MHMGSYNIAAGLPHLGDTLWLLAPGSCPRSGGVRSGFSWSWPLPHGRGSMRQQCLEAGLSSSSEKRESGLKATLQRIAATSGSQAAIRFLIRVARSSLTANSSTASPTSQIGHTCTILWLSRGMPLLCARESSYPMGPGTVRCRCFNRNAGGCSLLQSVPFWK